MASALCITGDQLVRFADRPEDLWLHCWECNRFFQYGRARPDASFGWGCPFCPAACFMTQSWDAAREVNDPRWPTSVRELVHGMQAPDMATFYDERNEHERHGIIVEFSESVEWSRLDRTDWPRWSHHLLATMASWAVSPRDLTPEFVADGVCDCFAIFSDATPEDAEAIVAELCAYFAFACRKLRHPWAIECLRELVDPGLPDELRETIALRRRPGRTRPSSRRMVRNASPPMSH